MNIETANCMLVYKKDKGWILKTELILQVQCLRVQTWKLLGRGWISPIQYI